jgi:hypothetical protein
LRRLCDDTGPGDRHAAGMSLALNYDQVVSPAGGRRAVARPTRRLGRRAHRAVLTAHVLSSVGWFGVAVTIAFCGIVGSSAGSPAFYEVMQPTLQLTIPLGLAAAVTGVILSVTTRWGLARHWWVVIKEAITIAVIATDVLVVGPEISRAIDTGAATELPGPLIPHCIVLAIATALSVIKPRAQTPLAARQPTRPEA